MNLVRFVLLISMVGATGTVLMDQLAAAAEASPALRRFVIPSGAALTALGGVALYNKYTSTGDS